MSILENKPKLEMFKNKRTKDPKEKRPESGVAAPPPVPALGKAPQEDLELKAGWVAQ